MNDLSVPAFLRGSGTPLARYDAACRALAEAKSVDEVQNIRGHAEAMRAYARQAQNKQLEIDALEIRIRAERRLGVLMEIQRKTIGLNKGGGDQKSYHRVEKKPGDLPTLAEAGIDKNLADRARKLAAIPNEQFEARLSEGRERVLAETGRIRTDLLRVGAEAENAARKALPVLTGEGRYSCIVIDPPWDMQKIEREVRPNQAGFDYPTMSEAELAALDVAALAADDCHLFCWTTQKFLPMALRLVEVWGFKYVLTMVWHKPGGFQPIGLPQYNCEFVVYARRGSPTFADTKAFPCCFNAQRREHSRKPDEFYDVIRRVTNGPRLDMFSREARDGFAQHGNETEKFSEAAA